MPYSSLDGGASDHIGIVSFGRPGETPADAKIWKWGDDAAEPSNIRDLAKEFASRSARNQPQRTSWDEGCKSLRLSAKALESAELGKIVII